ncbi:MAG: VWA domain-containing protein [Calditrichia bacterium]
MIRYSLLLLLLCFSFQINAQNEPDSHSPIVFIYDASGSMWGQLQGKTKMEVAVSVLSNSINNLPENQEIGFVAYGHRKEGDCQDVEFLIDIDNSSKSNVIEALKKIKPLGKTPLAFSALQVIDRLRTTQKKATIILLTDGIESCNGNICDVIKAAKSEGIDFKLHIIGFGLKAGETEQLECAADAGGGNYYDAADAGSLSDVMNEATATTVDKPDGNFTVFAIKNGKPIDAYVKAYRAGTKEGVDVKRTYADTVALYLPAGTYDLEIFPLGGSDVDAITLSNVQSFDDSVAHRTVSFDAGKIKVITQNNGEGWDAVVSVNAMSGGKRVASGRTYGKPIELELNPGLYSVEMKVLNIDGLATSHVIENVEVKAAETREITHSFKSGVAMIGATSATGLVDAVVRIVDVSANKAIANGRTYTKETNNPKKFMLNPGKYEITLTTLGVHKGKKESFMITVNENETITKIITF